MRKVIQVSSSLDSVGRYFIIAVCADGTLWQLNDLYREKGEPYWEPFPIPPNTPMDQIEQFKS
jgi:hypothetical protein